MICTDCGVDHDHESGLPPMYDMDQARREMAKARKRRDTVTREQVRLGDKLAHHLNAHFSAEELETAGRAVMLSAASIGGLIEDLPASVLVNILAFAADRLITDGQVPS